MDGKAIEIVRDYIGETNQIQSLILKFTQYGSARHCRTGNTCFQALFLTVCIMN